MMRKFKKYLLLSSSILQNPKIQLIIFYLLSVHPWVIMSLMMLNRIGFGTSNFRLFFASGGIDQVYVANHMYSPLSMGVPIFSSMYGSLYYYIALIPIMVISIFTPITEHIIAVVLQTESFICFISFGILSFILVKRKFGLLNGIFYSLFFFLLSNYNDFIHRATIVQPDMLNLLTSLFAFTSCIYLIDKITLKNLFYVAISTGLVMSVKHSGFLFLTLIALILLTHAIRDKSKELIRIIEFLEKTLIKLHYIIISIVILISISLKFLLVRGFLKEKWLPIPQNWNLINSILIFIGLFIISFIVIKLIKIIRSRYKKEIFNRCIFFYESLLLCIILFFMTFGVTSPGSFVRRLNFIKGLTTYYTDFNTVTGSILEWINLILNSALGMFLSVMLIIGICIVIWKVLFKKNYIKFKIHFITIIWLLPLLLLIFVNVGMVRARYLYPLYPAIMLIAVIPISICKDFIYKHSKIIGLVFLIILFSFLETRNINNIIWETKKTKANYSCINDLPGVQVGQWINDNCCKNTRIFQDEGAYIPQKFENIVNLSWGDPYIQLEKFDPDIVIINIKLMRFFNSLSDDIVPNIYLIPAGISKKFYKDLLDHKLQFSIIREFYDRNKKNGFIILSKDVFEK